VKLQVDRGLNTSRTVVTVLTTCSNPKGITVVCYTVNLRVLYNFPYELWLLLCGTLSDLSSDEYILFTVWWRLMFWILFPRNSLFEGANDTRIYLGQPYWPKCILCACVPFIMCDILLDSFNSPMWGRRGEECYSTTNQCATQMNTRFRRKR
jgi:hypothetical protein